MDQFNLRLRDTDRFLDQEEVAATVTRIAQAMPFLTSTTEWAQRTGTVGQDACPHRSTLLYLAHSSASTDSPHLFASSALGSYTLAGGSCLEIFYWFRCSGFVSTAHCTGKKGAYSLSASLSSRGCSWSKHARHAVYARGIDGSNSTAFSACLQKGNFEHNSKFHQNLVHQQCYHCLNL